MILVATACVIRVRSCTNNNCSIVVKPRHSGLDPESSNSHNNEIPDQVRNDGKTHKGQLNLEFFS